MIHQLSLTVIDKQKPKQYISRSMAAYNDMLSNLPREELAEATKFVTAHSECDGLAKVTSDHEPACPGDMNNGDLMRHFVSFVCACGERLNLEIIA